MATGRRLERPYLITAAARSSLMRYLEPGRKRRRSRPTAHLLWLVAAAMAIALAVQILVR